MLSTALLTFSISAGIFLALAVVVQVERVRSKRLILSGVRGWLDSVIVTMSQKWSEHWNHFTQYIVKLGWYYGIHSLLRAILRLLVSVYTHVEGMFERNRTRTKQLRQERKRRVKHPHFSQIAAHKAETALTPSEKAELRRQKLEQDQ